MTKEKHDYPLLTDSVAKKIFKNSVIGKEYSNVKKVIQIIIEDTDFFKLNDFVYSIAFMERKHGITDDEKIERYRINLDYLGKMKYTNIKKSN